MHSANRSGHRKMHISSKRVEHLARADVKWKKAKHLTKKLRAILLN